MVFEEMSPNRWIYLWHVNEKCWLDDLRPPGAEVGDQIPPPGLVLVGRDDSFLGCSGFVEYYQVKKGVSHE